MRYLVWKCSQCGLWLGSVHCVICDWEVLVVWSLVRKCSLHGLWCSLCGLWCSLCGLWFGSVHCMVFGVHCVVFGVHCVVFGLEVFTVGSLVFTAWSLVFTVWSLVWKCSLCGLWLGSIRCVVLGWEVSQNWMSHTSAWQFFSFQNIEKHNFFLDLTEKLDISF